MPLVPPLLNTELVKIMDNEAAIFEGFPENNVEVGQRWSSAVNTYACKVIPASLNAQAATQAFAAAMQSLDNDAQNGLVVFQSAFTAYAAQLALGMQPAFTGIPPPVPIVLDSIIQIGLSGAGGTAVAAAMTPIVDAWFRTGTAINNVSGVTIPWS